jgi:two-component system NtrC family sensor kinase
MSSPATELHQMAAVGRLLAGVVHEINTPIGSIFSNTEVILRSLDMLGPLLEDGGPESLERARRIVETCQALAAVDRIACERIRSVIRGLKTLSRTDAGETKRIGLNRLLLDSLKLTQAEFGKRITVKTELNEVPEIEGYPQMLGQVFLNLLVNAGQAIEGEGSICVSTRLDGDAIEVSIADTGRGMTPEQQAKAFQAGYTTKAVGEGTGMGLAISREIVEEKHGGTISFESRPGHGTVFRIRIPVRQTRSNGN